jgi:hypothetical protein
VALGSNPAQGQVAQAPGVPKWGRGPCSRLGQSKPALTPHGARVDLGQGQGNPNTINIIIFIIIEGINIKNTIICVININISTIVQSMNIKILLFVV